MTHFNTLAELQQELYNGEFTCAQLIEAYLKRIENHQNLNAFLEVFAHDARSRATVVDAKIKHGTAGKLAGMVIGIKDNIVYRGHRVSASSKMLEGFESLFSATVVQRLLDEDAIIIGRLNCDEFAMGASNKYSAYGPVRNPRNPQKVSGGSSGGSAAAVAANLCQVALGSDTAGSIRQPASFCGTFGFKPTYGRISRNGLIAFASSFDQIGPFSRSVKDASLVYEVIAGKDDFDNTVSHREVEKVADQKSPAKRKIAYFKDVLTSEHLDSEVKEKTATFIDDLKERGHTVEGVDFPMLDYLVPVYTILSTAEASSNLARYDGVHYGYRSENAHDLESTYKLSRTEGFGQEVKRRILLGTFVLSSGYYDAYYGKAQKARKLVVDKTEEIFKDFDYILSPTAPHTAFDIDQQQADPTKMYLEDIYTVHANLCGIPAVSLPLYEHSNELPFGMQFSAPRFKDADLMAFSQTLVNN